MQCLIELTHSEWTSERANWQRSERATEKKHDENHVVEIRIVKKLETNEDIAVNQANQATLVEMKFSISLAKTQRQSAWIEITLDKVSFRKQTKSLLNYFQTLIIIQW